MPSTTSQPRPDQIYTSTIPSPPLPRTTVFNYLFPASSAKAATDNYPKPNLNKVSYIDGITGQTLTREQTETKAKQLAVGLKKRGVKTGEVGCIFGMNSLDWVVACFGLQALGVVVSPANYAYTPSELLHQLSDSTSSLAFVQPALLPVLLEALKLDKSYSISPERIFLLCPKGEKPKDLQNKFESIEELLEESLSKDELNNVVQKYTDGLEKDTAYLCYSSGTTGRGKGVETSHHNVTSQIQAVNLVYEPQTGDDVILGILPFSHIYGLTVVLQQPLTYNGTIVVLPRFEEAPVLNAIQKYKITWALVVPPILIALLNSPNVKETTLSSLRGLQSGAAPLSSDLIQAFESRFPHIRITQGYGLTETTPVSHVMTLEEGQAHRGCIGRIAPTYQARLVDYESGKDCEKGERGELWLRGPSVMKGYWRNEEATKGVFAPGGWFMTGDVAVIDDQGYFSIVDRVKELVKYKGFQVPPAELEALLLTHPDVADVGVIGIWSKEQATELPRAYIVPRGGLSSISEKSKNELSTKIQKWVEGKVSNHKRLRGGVILIEAIPKSPSGKILRKDLRVLAKKEEEQDEVKKGRKAKL
ncbi:hypothetical protein CI109_103113 [Kwoniella shandongensis]|uniref:Uncharacterized protein n=1 Tax=Kwoniella shandongensis TaxID=1734106 RepID=A0A5M6CCA3_9TREE|nr:uncharacterized protein CI109_000303 [Kwoniella shandongensis]KAA5531462.1 hypothetical protein CI109_000303 [Kwoniella shandongensis]